MAHKAIGIAWAQVPESPYINNSYIEILEVHIEKKINGRSMAKTINIHVSTITEYNNYLVCVQK